MTTTETPPTLPDQPLLSVETGAPVAQRRQRRRLAERLTPGLIIGVIAALLAFVVIAGVLRERNEMTMVVVPSRSLTAGELITPVDVDVVEVPTGVAFSDELVSRADLDAGDLYAGRVLREGEPIVVSATSNSPAADERRTMALPLPDWGASGGELEIGDAIDLIDVSGDEPRYLVQAAAIVDRSTGDGGTGLGAQRGVWVSIEVSESEALDVAGVVDDDSFIVVRSGRGS